MAGDADWVRLKYEMFNKNPAFQGRNRSQYTIAAMNCMIHTF